MLVLLLVLLCLSIDFDERRVLVERSRNIFLLLVPVQYRTLYVVFFFNILQCFSRLGYDRMFVRTYSYKSYGRIQNQ